MNLLPAITKSGVLLATIFLLGCSGMFEENPPMDGFNLEGSDPRAVQLADSVMAAQGGRKAWDNTRYLAWNFLGSRKLIWDKKTGDVRVENLKNDTKILVNINSNEGKVYRNGAEVTHPDSLAKYLQKGKENWINDSYWLVMPYKLKDTGVTLKYLGEETTEAGAPAHVLQLTYENVGVTPDNKYHVSVDKQTHLVSQWAYFKEANNPEPNFVSPWQSYKTYGDIQLSGDRGERQITDIKVLEEVPDHTFTSFEPVNL